MNDVTGLASTALVNDPAVAADAPCPAVRPRQGRDLVSKPPRRIRLNLDGVLLLDKSAGLSSNDALTRVKRLMNAAKAGHTGTLDPFATGLLPLCFGEATKFSQDLLDADKTYEAHVRLGVTTDTGDCDGQPLTMQAAPQLSDAEIETALAAFRGPIRQIPPMYSALKRDGKPLYEYARAGIELEREARDVRILELVLLEKDESGFTIRVRCSKGTYIRVLAEDIGRHLGCGAHLIALRRTAVGSLLLADAVPQDVIESMPENDRPALLYPVDHLLLSFDAVVLPEIVAARFLHGQRITLAKENIERPMPVQTRRVRVYAGPDDNRQNRLIGTGILHEYGVLAPERVLAQRLSSP